MESHTTSHITESTKMPNKKTLPSPDNKYPSLRDGVPSLLTRDRLRWPSRSLPAAQTEVRECNVSCSSFRLIENKSKLTVSASPIS